MANSEQKTAARILRSTPLRPALAVVLRSGFDALQSAVKTSTTLPYNELPGFLPAKVDGHSGMVVVGAIDGVPVLLLCGRSHYYEGHSLADVTFPIRVLAACGIRALVLTNAAGGINPKYRPGDFMRLTDHLNFMGSKPLRGFSCLVSETASGKRAANRELADQAEFGSRVVKT